MDAREQHDRQIGAINEPGGIQAIVTVATVVTLVTKIGEQCLSATGTCFTVRKEGVQPFVFPKLMIWIVSIFSAI